MTQFQLTMPASRGIQCGSEFFSTMVPLRCLKAFFHFTDEAMPPEQRAQRILDESRARKIARYVIESEFWVLPAITVSIDANLEFEEVRDDVGILHIPMDARFLINDGQHRVRGLIAACEENPGLQDESISATIFHDVGLRRSQTIFADINGNAKAVSVNLNRLYNHRDPLSDIVRDALAKAPGFKRFVEMERASVGKRSRKFWTLQCVYDAAKVLFPSVCTLAAVEPNRERMGASDRAKLVKQYAAWLKAMAQHLPCFDTSFASSEAKVEDVATSHLGLMAIAHYLAADYQARLASLDRLAAFDWHRSNPAFEGSIIFDGTLTKNQRTISALADYLATSVTTTSLAALPDPQPSPLPTSA